MSDSPAVRRARLRMFGLALDVIPGSVAAWDQRTSMNDARSALQIAHGVPLDEIDREGYRTTERSAA